MTGHRVLTMMKQANYTVYAEITGTVREGAASADKRKVKTTEMLRKGMAILLILMIITVPACAEIVRIGKTDCLLQPASEEDCLKKYVLFVGSAEYFHACMLCGDITARDGELLIPQGNNRYVRCTAASDVVMKDIWPTLLSWAEEGFSIVLIGYSAGGYPASTLASRLAEKGYTGRLYLLDGISGTYRGIRYNEEYYRERLASWELAIWTSSDKKVEIAARSRKIGSALEGDANVDYRHYTMSHARMRLFYDVIMNGAEAPAPETESREEDAEE